MMNNQKLHEEVKKLARIYLESERNLIGPLIEVKQLKAYRDFECHGLDEYCEQQLGFSESVARMFQTVVNHAIRKPKLREALETDRLSVTYASKIVSQLTDENIEEVLKFSEDHSIGETEKWLAEKSGAPQFRNFPLALENWDWLFKIMDAAPDKTKGNATIKRALMAEYKRVHPVERARRADEKKAKRKSSESVVKAAPQKVNKPDDATAAIVEAAASESNTSTIPEKFKRIPLTAEQKNAVHDRDGFRCTHRNSKGQRCKETTWLEIHHIVFVSDGGGNEPENLTTLCSEHHDLVHQMSFNFCELFWNFPHRSPSFYIEA